MVPIHVEVVLAGRDLFEVGLMRRVETPEPGRTLSPCQSMARRRFSAIRAFSLSSFGGCMGEPEKLGESTAQSVQGPCLRSNPYGFHSNPVGTLQTAIVDRRNSADIQAAAIYYGV
jgi:hypothetical protein